MVLVVVAMVVVVIMMVMKCKKCNVLFTGGRDGSAVLDETEVLYYPGQYVLHHQQVSITDWAWAQPEMLYHHLWDNVVPQQMKKLPIPLTGRYILVLLSLVEIRKDCALIGHDDKSFPCKEATLMP